MNFKKILASCTLALAACTMAFAADAAGESNAPVAKKVTKTTKAASTATSFDKMLVGKHMLSLQWISWDYYGSVNITKEGENNYHCVGEQLDREHQGDYVKIDGYLRAVDDKNLVFNGTIAVKIYHLNGGQEYVRNGEFNFKSTQGRKYWRLQEMENPDGAVDYVDIYMKTINTKSKAKAKKKK